MPKAAACDIKKLPIKSTSFRLMSLVAACYITAFHPEIVVFPVPPYMLTSKVRGKHRELPKHPTVSYSGLAFRMLMKNPRSDEHPKTQSVTLDDGWPESEERCSEICKSEDGIA